MSEDSVKVAVRVRPFNSREKQRNAVSVIKMEGKSTIIRDPADNSEKTFVYDFSYWSHDGFEEQTDGYLAPVEANYADQKQVFEDLGQGVLDNAWQGYNCSLFAYGQTGSGKSYSMVGYGVNKGIVPVTCDELFKIYNEQVQDLLDATKVKGGLKVRQHPKKGFYVDGLRVIPVHSFGEIEARIEEGTKNRTIAATNMNATSSRAHTIVAVNVKQKATNEGGVSMTKMSCINLVDLAGSERAESTGATGDRLKEGAAINQSLSTLGNVISALVDAQNGKQEEGGQDTASAEELGRLMEQNHQEMLEMKKTWEERLEEEKRKHAAIDEAAMREKEKRKTVPHFWNLNEDPALSCVIAYFIEKDEVIIGNGKGDVEPDILLKGVGIAPRHAAIKKTNGKIFIHKADTSAKILVNGKELEEEAAELRHFSRILLGPSQLYCISIPSEATTAELQGKVFRAPTYEDAQAEIARHSGMTTNMSASPEQLLLQEEIESLLPHISEANAISADLDKNKVFSLELIQDNKHSQKPEVKVRVEDSTGASWVWTRNHFLNRKFAMVEMFNARMEDDPDWDRPIETPLCFKMDLEENVSILNHSGQLQGSLNVRIAPCRADGSPFDLDAFDVFVENPDELIGRPFYIMLTIASAAGLPPRFSNITCRYEWFDHEEIQTQPVNARVNPKISHSKIITLPEVTKEELDWMSNEMLIIHVWGDQTGAFGEHSDIFQKTRTLASLQLGKLKSNEYQETLHQMRCEISLYRRRADRLAQRIGAVNALVNASDRKGSIPVADVQEALRKGVDVRFKGAVQSVMVGLNAQKWREKTPAQRDQPSSVCSFM
eukprot:gene10210-2367_t